MKIKMNRMKSTTKIIVLALTMIGAYLTSTAQDGEALFKANCAACHKVNEQLVGPPLKGVQQKWIDAGEKENLYEWVKDSQKLIDSGKSKMALEAEKISPIVMAPQPVKNDEIDAIFDYVNNWVAPAPKKEVVVPPGGKIPLWKAKKVDGLSSDTYRGIFILQLIVLFFLVLAAIFFSSTIKKLAVMGINESKGNGTTSKVILALIGTGIATSIPTAGYSLSLDMSGEHLINATLSDNVILFIINLVMLGLVLYLRGIITTISHSINPGYYVNKKGEKVQMHAPEGNLASVLTAQVPIEDEGSILLDHDYDGIQELDNHLPPWWLVCFYISIAFAVYYHFTRDLMGTVPDQYTLYNQEMKEAEQEVAAYMAAHDPGFDETNVTLATEASELAEGKKVFAAKCVTCHSADGEGGVGPNLTDEYWLYGNDIKDVFTTIKYGRGGGIMPAHEDKLKAEQIRDVASYVLSLPYKEGKAPQGEKR